MEIDRDKLITDNIKLIYFQIKKMHLHWKTDDEFQEYYDAGLDGLMNAAKYFDPSLGNKFSTLALISISNEIKKKFSLKTIKKRFNPLGKDLSLNYLVSQEDPIEFGDLFQDKTVNIELDFENKLDKKRILKAVDSLKNEKDKFVIKMYYGLDGFSTHTHDELANLLGVSRQLINFRLQRARKQLKNIYERIPDKELIKGDDNY